jgi:ABC-type glycerol-3-phosphate transport system permease component
MKKYIFWTIERALLLFVSLIVLFPIFWMFLTSLKQPRDAYSISLNFQPTLENLPSLCRPLEFGQYGHELGHCGRRHSVDFRALRLSGGL